MTIERPWYKMQWQLWLAAIVVIAVAAYLHSLENRPIEISIASVPIGQNRTLKERMIFVVSLEKSFHKKGWLAKIDLEGENGKTLMIYWERINLPFVRQWAKSNEMIGDIREMGFKRLMLSNGKASWDIDLKN
jgi:hypothetical protein